MTHSQFQKFKVDWDVYKQISHIPNINLAAQLYHLCSNFFTLTESDILQTLKSIVTKHSNPADHHLNFSNLYQHEHESIKDYFVRLKDLQRMVNFLAITAVITY